MIASSLYIYIYIYYKLLYTNVVDGVFSYTNVVDGVFCYTNVVDGVFSYTNVVDGVFCYTNVVDGVFRKYSLTAYYILKTCLHSLTIITCMDVHYKVYVYNNVYNHSR